MEEQVLELPEEILGEVAGGGSDADRGWGIDPNG